MKRILLASAAVAVMAGAAYAAEPLEPIAPPPPPVVEPFIVPTWAGPYVGADIGWGWADLGDDENGFFHDDFFDDDFDNGLFDDDDEELDGVVGGVFAGWLGQSGTFLYGVELFGQIADINGDDDDDDDNGLFHDLFDEDEDFFTVGSECFFDPDDDIAGDEFEVDCPVFGSNVKVHALFGLEGMIGWGGDRTAFLLHAGPALGWFQRENGQLRSGDPDFDRLFDTHDDDDDEIELGVSVAAEGRFKLTERVFAGVIGRAFWFPNVGDDDDNNNGLFNGNHHDDDDDVTVFEVKARLGVMFGQPPVAAPVEAAF